MWETWEEMAWVGTVLGGLVVGGEDPWVLLEVLKREAEHYCHCAVVQGLARQDSLDWFVETEN